MKNFLHVSVGTIAMLLPVGSVLEIISLNEKRLPSTSADDLFDWRQQLLPIIDCKSWLEIDAKPTLTEYVGVVYRPDFQQVPVLLVVDYALRQFKLNDSDFAQLPPVPQRVFHYFKKVYIDQNLVNLVYCLRSDLLLEDFIQMNDRYESSI
jgi:chemotaxis signal transduction protein